MPEKKIVYSVEIEGNEATLQEIARLREETERLKRENKEYNRALKAGESVSKEQARNFERNTIQVRKNRTSINQLTKEVEANGAQTENARRRLTKMRQELQEMAIAGDTSSEAYKTLRGEASQLQDAIDRVSNEIKVFADDALVINTVVDSTRALTAGMQGVMGVQALLGFESEKFRETMQRLVAVQQVSNSLQTVSNLLQKESRLVILGKVAAVKVATAAQWAWNAAMTANPIGLIVAAVVGLGAAIFGVVKYFDQITAAIRRAANWIVFWKDFGDAADVAADEVSTVAEVVDNLIKRIEDVRGATQKTVSEIEHQIRLMQILGASEEELQKQRLRAAEEKHWANIREQRAIETAIKNAEELIGINIGIIEGLSEWEKGLGSGIQKQKESQKIIDEQTEALERLNDAYKENQENIRESTDAKLEERMKLAVIQDDLETRKEVIDAQVNYRKEILKNIDLAGKEFSQRIKSQEEELHIQQTIREVHAGLIRYRYETIKQLETFEAKQKIIHEAYKRRTEERRKIEEEEQQEILKRERFAAAKLRIIQEGTLDDHLELLELKRKEALDQEGLTHSEILLINEQYEQDKIDLIKEFQEKEKERLDNFVEEKLQGLEGNFKEKNEIINNWYEEELISFEEFLALQDKIHEKHFENERKREELFGEIRGNEIDRRYVEERKKLKEKHDADLLTNEEYYEALKELDKEIGEAKRLEEIEEWYNEQHAKLKQHLNNKLLTHQQHEILINELNERRRLKEQEQELEEFEEERMRYIEHLKTIRTDEEIEFQQRKEMYQRWLNDKVISTEEYNARIKQLDEDLSDFRQNLALAEAQAMATAYRQMTTGLSQLMQGKEETSKFMKALAIVDAGVALTLGLIQTARAGFPQNIPLIVGYVAQTAGLMSQIMNQNVPSAPKLEKGGVIGGKPHSRGGTQFIGSDGSRFEAEKDEYLAIVNKRDSQRAAMLDAVNSEHGESFGDGGIFHRSIKKFQRGGIFEPRTDFEINDIETIISETVDRIAHIPVIVNERDITGTQEKVRKIHVKGDLQKN